MSKAFTKEGEGAGDDAGDDEIVLPALPSGGKNYITPVGYATLREELLTLIDVERPKVVEIVHWAASNGDRSENGDYIYGKKRLREIDRRIRFLTQRLEIAVITEPSVHFGNEQIFFGATVTYADGSGDERAAGGCECWCGRGLGGDEPAPRVAQDARRAAGGLGVRALQRGRDGRGLRERPRRPQGH